MKIKLTTFLFGLLLAVGWTSSAFAQSAVYKAADMANWTYTWENAQGTTQTSHYVELNENGDYEAPAVTDAYQIYGLLRAIYMDKRLPGPYQSAYDKNGNREDDVYYGGARNGWDIPGNVSSGITSAIGAKTITVSNYSSDYNLAIIDIKIVSGTKIIESWDYATNGTTLPFSFTGTGRLDQLDDGTYYLYFTGSGGTITIPADMTAGYESVEVQITATGYASYPGTISVGGTSQTINSYTTYVWNFNAGLNTFATDTYKPNEEGYTAVVVALKNTPYIPQEPSEFVGSTAYQSKDSVINYIERNIEFVKLLTDGLRIKDGDAPGTVFNCDGTYNKFFFLGKGKARQKGAEVKTNISNGTYPYYAGECVIFWPLFEEFSPTTAHLVGASTVVDFYDRMNEGQVYDVVHDCAGVIQNRHEFTLAGEDKTDDFPFTGMNFFIPDYRLKYWVGNDSVYNSSTGVWDPVENVDGRNMNGMYQIDGTQFKDVSPYYSNYAQYNPDYAPKVGIYKITLSAVATQIADSHNPENQNFVVTLTWVSSLDEMSGTTVPQTYTIYLVDNVTGEQIELTATGVTNPTGVTTVSYMVPQGEHSYTLKYRIMGTPDDNDHPDFVAWSNRASVIIPGWDDFIGLQLDHHESDFKVSEMANYYRNFLTVVNEDTYNGLTVSKIQEGMNTFTLYRYEGDVDETKTATPIATITFGTPSNGTVPYTVSYVNEQELLETPKYNLDENHLNIPLTGVVRVKGNGDIVIWPNGYHVNFKSITVKDGNNVLASWNVANNSDLPGSWILSPGSIWEQYTNTNTGDLVGYVEGGGYIAIPGILSNHPNATVEIVAYGDGANVSRITVNDAVKTIANSTAATYTWGPVTQNDDPLSPNAAPKRDNNNNN